MGSYCRSCVTEKKIVTMGQMKRDVSKNISEVLIFTWIHEKIVENFVSSKIQPRIFMISRSHFKFTILIIFKLIICEHDESIYGIRG